MRVTNRLQTQTFIDQILGQQRELADLRAQVASGFKVAKASDDAGSAGTIVFFQNTLARLDENAKRMDYAENLLVQQESIIDNSSELMIRAKELANQASNEVYSPEQRRALAVEVFALRDAIVANANTRVLGRYIYGGSADDAPPYALTTPGYTVPVDPNDPAAQRYEFTTALGANNGRVARINDSEVMDVTSGGAFFQGAINALERLGRALEGYRTTPENSTTAPDLGGVAYVFPAEYTDQSAAIRNAMDQIDTAIATFSDERSTIGGRLNRIGQARALNGIIKENVETNRSGIQDADLAETASYLASLQNSYQALLSTGAQINRLSLLDFI